MAQLGGGGPRLVGMHVIAIFLPLYDREGRRFGPEPFDAVRREMVEHFGGLTAFTRSPAEGLWSEGEGEGAERDYIVIFEVMADELDRGWWHEYRSRLEARFRQDVIIVRAHEAQQL